MPQVLWLTGGNQVARDLELAKVLKPFVSANRQPGFLAITPTRRRSSALEQSLVKAWQMHGGIWRPAIFLVDELAGLLFDQGLDPESHGRLIGDLEQLVCLEETLEQLAGKLEYFNRLVGAGHSLLRDYPGVLERLSGFLGFLKQSDLERDFADRLVLDEFGNTGAKDHDLTLILAHYTELLRSHHLLDREDRLVASTEALQNGRAFTLLDGKQALVLDGLTFVTRLEEKFLRALASRFERIIVVLDSPVPIDDLLADLQRPRLETVHPAYRIYRPIVAWLRTLRDSAIFSQDEVVLQRDLSARMIGRLRLFDRAVTPELLNTAPVLERISVIPQVDRTAEVIFIARQIKRLVLSGTPMSRISVVFPKLDHYLSLVYELFPQYGIPFHITRGLALHSSPLAIVVRSILYVPQGYQRDDLFRFFSSNLVSHWEDVERGPFEDFLRRHRIGERSLLMTHVDLMDRYDAYRAGLAGQGRSRAHLDMATLDRYARSANVQGGPSIIDDWFIPLEAYFSTRIRSLPSEAKTERESLSRNYFLIVRQLDLLERLKKVFDPFRQATDESAVLDHLRSLIVTFRIPENLLARLQDMPDLPQREKRLLLKRDVDALQKIFAILEDLREAFVLRRQMTKQALSPEDVLIYTSRVLSHRLSQEFLVDPLDADVVQVTETLEVRGLEEDVCFVGGLTAEDFPRLPQQDFILPETPNARFRILDPADESRFLFHAMLQNAKVKVFLTYPRRNGQEELDRSPFVEDLLTEVRSLESKGADSAHSPNSSDEIYCASELERRIGELALREDRRGPWEALLRESTNPQRLLDMLKIEHSRANRREFGPWDGMLNQVASPDAEEATYSISQLEKFAACPQHYFYARILGLEPLDEVTEEMEADEFGSYVHEILELFFRTWKEGGHKAVTKEKFSEALALMNQLAGQVLDKQLRMADYILWDEKKRKLMAGLDPTFDATKEPSGILRGLLEHEVERAQEGFEPFAFEHTFGYSPDEFRIGGVRLRGKIDRLDRRQQLPSGRAGLVVLDYKTGWYSKPKKVLQGLSYQLPVYLRAAQALDPQAEVGGAYYALRDPTDIHLDSQIVSTDLASFGALDTRAKRLDPSRYYGPVLNGLIEERIQAIDKQIQSGGFHVTFEEVLCPFCDFRNICRRDVERLRAIERTPTPELYHPLWLESQVETILDYLRSRKETEKILTSKKEQQKARKLTEKQRLTLGILQKAFRNLPDSWRERFAGEQQALEQQWSGLA